MVNEAIIPFQSRQAGQGAIQLLTARDENSAQGLLMATTVISNTTTSIKKSITEIQHCFNNLGLR